MTLCHRIAFMQTPPPKSPTVAVQSLLNHCQLEKILFQAKRLQQLQALLAQLQPELSQHCQVANFKDGELILAVSSAAWAMRVRFLAPELLKSLKKNLPGLTKIQTQITMPLTEKKAEPYWPKLALSDNTREMLAGLADTISDEKLKKNLLQLAKLQKPIKER